MGVSQLHCGGCSLNLHGQFMLPRLARLAKEHLRLAEQFLSAGGNLKLLAQQVGVSYPTLRRRVDEMLAALKALQEEDRARADALLRKVESGQIPAQEGLRLIREMNNED